MPPPFRLATDMISEGCLRISRGGWPGAGYDATAAKGARRSRGREAGAIVLSELVAIAENPVPPGGLVQELRTRDGRRLRAACWPATRSTVRGSICLMGGRAEFIEKYFEVIGELRARGFAVFTFDWRGQGGSERLLANPRKGHVGSYADYGRDLAAALDRMGELGLPQPWFGLAHSMGGTATLLALAAGEHRLDRCLLSAPFIGLHESRPPRGARLIAEVLGALGMARSFIPGGGGTSVMTRPFKGNFLTSDEARYRRTADVLAARADLGIGDPTVGWIRASYRAFARMARLDFGYAFQTPLLVITAGADTLVSSRAAALLAQRIKGAALLDIAGARHEIMMEQDPIRTQFWAAFDAFIPGERPDERAGEASGA